MKSLLFLFLVVLTPFSIAFGGEQQYPDSAAASIYTEGNYWKLLELSRQYGVDTLSPKFHFYLGMSYAALGETQRAQELLRKAIALDSSVLQYRYHYGRLLAQSGLYDDAVVQLTSCIAMDSNYIPAVFQLGLTYAARKKETDKEIEIFSYLIGRNPNDFLGLYYISDTFKRMGYDDSSAIYLQLSLKINPRYYPALIALSNYLSKQNRLNDALRYYLRADSIRRDNKDLLFQIGECYRKMGDIPAAKRNLKRAVDLDSMNGLFHAQLAYAHFSAGEFDSSVAEYQKAVLYDEENVQYRLNLALAYKKLDLTPMVVATYADAVRVMHPENIAYVYNDLAAFCFGKNMWRESATAYRRVLDIKPDQVEALYFLGLSYERLSENRNAISALQRYIRQTASDTSKKGMRHSAVRIIEQLRSAKK